MIYQIYSFIRSLKNQTYTLFLRNCFQSFGKNSLIEAPIRLGGTTRITIGSNVFIGSDSWITAALADDLNETKTSLEIGSGTSISGHCTITSANKVIIGENVLIARYAYISDHSHHYKNTTQPIKEQGITSPRAVHIGSGTWLGQNVVITPGVSIGVNCVIGANSVVKNDIPDFTIAAGNPAKIIKSTAARNDPRISNG